MAIERPWDSQILDYLIGPGPYFAALAVGCGIVYAAARCPARRSKPRPIDLLLETLVVGTAAAGLFLIVFVQSAHLFTGRPAADGSAFLGISVFFPFVGLSNLIWFFCPWWFEKFSKWQKTTVVALAVGSLALSCIWKMGNFS
ncbi:MAG: hypothetical protein HOP09_03815 [Hyphomicrobium sp.]|nr:hypothetical protein [Hyphomicrobium sp.]